MRKLIVCLVMTAVSLPAWGAGSSNPLSDALRDVEGRRAKNLVAAAEEMPADKYGFHPTPAQMTFGHLVLHVAMSNFDMCSQIAGVATPEQKQLADTASKDELVNALKSSFDFCTSSLAKTDDMKLGETVTLFGHWKLTRAAAMLEAAGDWADHYGMAAIYLRLNGLLPPTAKKKE